MRYVYNSRQDFINQKMMIVHMFRHIVRTYVSSICFLLEHNGVFSEHNEVFSEHNRVFPEHNKVFSEHNRVFSEHNRVFPEHNKVFSEHNEVFSKQNAGWDRRKYKEKIGFCMNWVLVSPNRL